MNRRRDSKPHALPVHPWSEQHGPLRGRLGSAQILSGRLAGPAHSWELAHEFSRPLSRFVDFGEMSETCAPVSNEAKRPSRSAQYRLILYGGEVGLFQGMIGPRGETLLSLARPLCVAHGEERDETACPHLALNVNSLRGKNRSLSGAVWTLVGTGAECIDSE